MSARTRSINAVIDKTDTFSLYKTSEVMNENNAAIDINGATIV
jgi:hypothetical protein